MTTVTENNRYEWIAASGLKNISLLDTQTQTQIRNDFINKIFQFRDTLSSTHSVIEDNLDVMIPTNKTNQPIGQLAQPVHFVTNTGVAFGKDPTDIRSSVGISATNRRSRNDWDEIYQTDGQNYGIAENLDFWLPKDLTLHDANSQLIIHHHITDEHLFYADGLIADEQAVHDHPELYELAVRDKLSLTLTTKDTLTANQIAAIKQACHDQMLNEYGDGATSYLADNQNLLFIVIDTQA